MGQLFGTNGVRGIFGDDFTLDTAYRLTMALARHFGRGPILVGYDGRHAAPLVAGIVRATLNWAGLDCRDAGLVPTPCLEYCVRHMECAGGIMVTASHNPPPYIGIKPVAPDGVEVSRDDEARIETYYYDTTPTEISGSWGNTSMEDAAIKTYIDGVLSHVDATAISDHIFTIVLDVGNGAQAMAAPLLCNALGCDVVWVNQHIDGSFPGRGPEPTVDNLDTLSKVVRLCGADLGMAFDGDGDRSMLCDETGRILSGDVSSLLTLQHLLKTSPRSTIVTCLNSGDAVEKLSAMYDASVIRTRVGSVEVSRRMVTTGALAGFEENGGFMYGPHNQVRDGLMTLALVLDALHSSDRTISDMVSSLPRSFTAKAKVNCGKHSISHVMESLLDEHPGADTTDGIKIRLAESQWVMVRASGTEPAVRIYAEAPNGDTLDSLMAKYTHKVKDLLHADP